MLTFIRGPREIADFVGWSRGDGLGQPLQLVRVGDGGEEDQLVAALLLVPADEVLNRPRRGQVGGRDPLGEAAGEGVVVAQIVGAALRVAEGEIALAPKLRRSRPLGFAPGGAGPGGGAREGSRRAATVHVTVGEAGGAQEGR